MQVEAGVRHKPMVHRRCLVGGEVVADHVDRQAGFGLAVDLVQEVAEVDCAVLRGQLPDDFPGRDVQCGEQVHGAVSDVVETSPFRDPGQHRQHRCGPLQGLDLRLLVNGEDHRVRRRCQVEAHHVPDLVDQQRIRGHLEDLGSPGLQSEGRPDPQHAAG